MKPQQIIWKTQPHYVRLMESNDEEAGYMKGEYDTELYTNTSTIVPM